MREYRETMKDLSSPEVKERSYEKADAAYQEEPLGYRGRLDHTDSQAGSRTPREAAAQRQAI